MKRILGLFCILILIGSCMDTNNKKEVKKSIVDSRVSFICLRSSSIENYYMPLLDDFSNGNVDNVVYELDDLLNDLKKDLNKSEYKIYLDRYQSYIDYEVEMAADKKFAKRIILKVKEGLIKGNTLNQEDIEPVLLFLLIKNCSKYFNNSWYSRPYIEFSEEFYEIILDGSFFLDLERQLTYDSDEMEEYKLYNFHKFNFLSKRDELSSIRLYSLKRKKALKMLDELLLFSKEVGSNENLNIERLNFEELLNGVVKDDLVLLFTIN